MNVYDAQKRPVWLAESIGRGGEAIVYRIRGQSGLLAKIYERAPRSNYPRKLAWMLGHPPHNPMQEYHHASFAWPAGLLYDSQRRLVGYSMPFIQGAVPILGVFNPRRRSETLPGFDRRYLHRTARNLATTLGALHRAGYVVGDLNESNVLVTPSALVTLIDADSFQVEEQQDARPLVHPCPVGKLEYTPPELQGQAIDKIFRLPEHDSFGLGVLIFQLLMEGNHPFRAQWLGSGDPPPIEVRIAGGGFPYMASPPCPVRPPKNAPALSLLHPEISELLRRCFVDGHQNPSLRPSPAVWEQAITRAEKALARCRQGHIYSNHLRACPRCPPPPKRTGVSWPEALSRKPKEDNPASESNAKLSPASVPAKSSPAPAVSAKPASPSRPVKSSPSLSKPPRFGFHRRPVWRKVGLWNWIRPRLYKSLAVGGGMGALAGALPGALISLAGWSSGHSADWAFLWALGGAAGGTLRGWKPGYRLGIWVDQYIGWHRFWQAAGLLGGALAGSLTGLIFGWAIFPVCLGLFGGAHMGLLTGRKVWLIGRRFGWERIWALAGGAALALMGGAIAWLAGAGGLGGLADQLASSMAQWLIDHSGSWTLIWALVGALGGALGGAIAGIFADLFARLSGLVD